jgi:hypothetical protein
MDANFTVTLGVWVPKGFCEKNIAEQEWDNNNGFRDNTYIEVEGEKFCLGVVPYTDEYGDELMGIYFHSDFIDGMGIMNAQTMRDALNKSYDLEDKLKQEVKKILPEEHHSYADKMKVIIWGVIPWGSYSLVEVTYDTFG